MEEDNKTMNLFATNNEIDVHNTARLGRVNCREKPVAAVMSVTHNSCKKLVIITTTKEDAQM